MPTIDSSLPDIPYTPEERFHELAAILAAALLRLRIRPQLAPGADMSGRPAAPEESSEPGATRLAFPCS